MNTPKTCDCSHAESLSGESEELQLDHATDDISTFSHPENNLTLMHVCNIAVGIGFASLFN